MAMLLWVAGLALAQEHAVKVMGIQGVVARGSRWTVVWQGTDNADGIVASMTGGMLDGGLLFAQEQTSVVSKADRNGTASVYLKDTHGTGALTVDAEGRILGAERTCTDPGRKPAHCKEATAVAELFPERKILADDIDGKSLGRLNDLVADKKGGVYFNGNGLYYLKPSGKVIGIGENIRTNGLTLSRDEKTLYVTNGAVIVAFDIQPDGTVSNQRDFGRLEAGGVGNGMAIDSEGRLYVTSDPGVQVLDAEGKYLGVIPAPRPVISAAFSGPDKRTLYVVGRGALGADGKEYEAPEGERNNAKTIYKIGMLAQGFEGRVK